MAIEQESCWDATGGVPPPPGYSWWMKDAIAAEPWPLTCGPLLGEHRYDVAIVGGGYTGLWTALVLRERNPSLSIVVLEKDVCGSGASGMNGGKVHGYWASLGSMAGVLGDDAALDLASAGSRAQDAIRAFATAPGRDVWWKEAGHVRVAASAAQRARIAGYLHEARRLGAADSVIALSSADVAALCRSNAFHEGLFFPEGANVHPARLVRALRAEVMARGIPIHEHTPVIAVDAGAPVRVRTRCGAVIAHDVVLATNVALAGDDLVRRHLSIFSSYAVMTAPAWDALARMNWLTGVGFGDLRMFLHYFRRTEDGRVLMGSGSGPIAFGTRIDAPELQYDLASVHRAVRGLRRLLPALSDVPIEASWGGAIDVSADRYPFVRTRRDARVHVAAGFSGHGINPSYIAAQCLASKVLGVSDLWSRLPLCTRDVPALPPEPLRCYGGRLVRHAYLACEAAEDLGRRPGFLPRQIAALPRRLGIRLGTR